MTLKARRIASVLFLTSSVGACLLVVDAWVSRSGSSLFFASMMTLQGASLLCIALGRKLNSGIGAAFLCWCLLSGIAFPLLMVNYARHHGAEGWVQAAGVPGVINESGQFYSSTLPVSRKQMTITLSFAVAQLVSALIFRVSRSINTENAEPHSA